MSGDTPYSLGKGLRVLGVAIREQPRMFAAAAVASALFAVMTVGTARAVGWATQHVVLPAFRDGRTTVGALLVAVGAILGAGLAKVLGVVGRKVCAGVMQYRLQASYRRRVTRQYLRLPLAWHHRHPTGVLLSNANADVEAAWLPIAPLPFAIGSLVMLVVALVSMLLTDPVLGGVGVLLFPAIGLLNFGYQRVLAPRVTRAQRLRAEVSEVAHESFDGALVVKALGRESDETSRFRGSAEKLRDANVSVGRIRGLFDPALDAIPNLGVLVVLLVGLARIGQGAVEAGELVQIAYLFTVLAFPIRAVGWVLGELPRSVVGWERVSYVLGSPGRLSYGDSDLDESGAARVATRDLWFRYDSRRGDDSGQGETVADGGSDASAGAGGDVLRGVDFTVPAGRTVAVAGHTGAGKSTLATLLVRLFDPDGGQVLMDGVDVRDVRPGGLPAATAVVTQQTYLFDDDVRGNVTLGEELSDERVWAALRLAQADGFVAALSRGLDTRVGERGASLSGGQRQRLALARALVRSPRLLVLDDATSSVDPQVETRILRGLRDAEMPSTTVVVAYRMSTIRMADEVVYLEGGEVRARGTHTELLDRSEGYAGLVTAYERADAQRRLFSEQDGGRTARDQVDDVAEVEV